MSLFAALTVAVGGLAAQSSAIGNISDNLSNSQTTGFKSIETNFESLVTQSNSQVNDPGGVRATPHYANDQQGNLIASSSSTSLAITGQGFFAVRPATVSANGISTFSNTSYYTRAGDFTLNKDGFLVNSGGYYLTGYNVDSVGNVDTSASNPIQLAALLDNPVATSTVSYAANLPASATSTVASPFTSPSSTIQVYDKFGAQHNLSFTWDKQPIDKDLAATADIGSGSLTLQAHYSGTFGNNITATIAAGSVSGKKITIAVPGQASEVYDNIGGTGTTFWSNVATAINTSSRLVSAQAGTTGATPANGTTTLASGTGSTINYAATYTSGGEMLFSALNTGTAGNNITVSIANGSVSGKLVTISNGTTTETYDNIAGSNAAFWTNVATAVNGAPSTLVEATALGGTTNPVNGTNTLSGGQAPITDNNNLWYLTVSVPGGGGVNPLSNAALDYTATIPFNFYGSTSGSNSAGTIQTIGATTATGASGTYTPTSSPGLAQISLPLDFSGSGATGTQSITIGFGTYGSSSSGVTQFADTSVSVSSFTQNGIPRGSFQSLSIDKHGFVALNYDNGQTRTISQIPIVQFFAQDQLQRVTGGAYAATLDSGDPRYSIPGSNGAGTVVGSSLEGSNVDIAGEFTKLIEAQRVYSANARTITTVDNMLQEVINVIR